MNPNAAVPVLFWLEDLKGISEAWKVESHAHPDENGGPRSFATKYFRSTAGNRERRVVEYVCASVANWLEVGAPEVVLLDFSEEFLSALGRLRVKPQGLETAEPGRQLGIAYVEHAVELIRHEAALRGLANPRQPAEIIGCDAYLQNIDRHDSNVLLHPAAFFGRASHKLIPIDWGACLASVTPDRESLAAIVGERSVREQCVSSILRNRVQGVQDFETIRGRIADLRGAKARLEGLINWMPAEWNVPEEWRAALLDYFSRRIDVVIDRLEDAGDPDAVFPNWQLSLGA